jgi:hypothetical protein
MVHNHLLPDRWSALSVKIMVVSLSCNHVSINQYHQFHPKVRWSYVVCANLNNDFNPMIHQDKFTSSKLYLFQMLSSNSSSRDPINWIKLEDELQPTLHFNSFHFFSISMSLMNVIVFPRFSYSLDPSIFFTQVLCKANDGENSNKQMSYKNY